MAKQRGVTAIMLRSAELGQSTLTQLHPVPTMKIFEHEVELLILGLNITVNALMLEVCVHICDIMYKQCSVALKWNMFLDKGLCHIRMNDIHDVMKCSITIPLCSHCNIVKMRCFL